MQYAYRLKGTSFGLNRDYLKEITEARKSIWPAYIRLREENGRENVKIKFPCALIVNNGKVEYDMFPDWRSVLSGSRHNDLTQRVKHYRYLNKNPMKF